MHGEEGKNISKDISVGVAIFVKTPGKSPIKTRLAKTVGKEVAEEFYLHSTDVLYEVCQAACGKFQGKADVYWSIAEKESDTYWKTLPCIYQGEGDLGDRMHQVYQFLCKKYSHTFLLGSDSPQIMPEVLIKAIAALKDGNDFVIGPALDGGFYLLGGSKAIPLNVWKNTPYSDPNTMDIFVNNLNPYGKIFFTGPTFDVDTEKDMHLLQQTLQRNKKKGLSSQNKLLEWLRLLTMDT